MSYNENEMYNILVRKVNEIIDTLSQLEEFDTLAYKGLNDKISAMNYILDELKGYNIIELIAYLDSELNRLKGDRDE